MGKKRVKKNMDKLTTYLVIVIAALVLFNQYQLLDISGNLGSAVQTKHKSETTPLLTGDPMQDAISLVIPTGTPFYGEELGVSFDDPIGSLAILAQLDPGYGRSKAFDKNSATPEEWQRYIKINTIPTLTCEFCCGVKTGVRGDGSPACGCKHVWATRGISAYLIRNYPDISDDEIAREISRWKGLFFPKQMIKRFLEEQQSGEYTPDIASLLLDVDAEKLGTASGEVPLPTSLQELPSMVGGC